MAVKLISGKKVVFALLLGLFLVAGIGGVFSLCGMSPLDHLSHWQAVSVATAQQMPAVALLLLMVVAAFLYFLQDVFLLQQRGEYLPHYRDGGRLFDPLRLAFARGILNTKAY